MRTKIAKPEIRREALYDESFTPERLFITEMWNSPDDDSVSIARARLEPGMTTALHYLAGVDERYLITSGRGVVEVGKLAPTEVTRGDIVVIPEGTTQRITNVGDHDLVFYCICTPRFTPDCYHQVGNG